MNTDQSALHETLDRLLALFGIPKERVSSSQREEALALLASLLEQDSTVLPTLEEQAGYARGRRDSAAGRVLLGEEQVADIGRFEYGLCLEADTQGRGRMFDEQRQLDEFVRGYLRGHTEGQTYDYARLEQRYHADRATIEALLPGICQKYQVSFVPPALLERELAKTYEQIVLDEAAAQAGAGGGGHEMKETPAAIGPGWRGVLGPENREAVAATIQRILLDEESHAPRRYTFTMWYKEPVQQDWGESADRSEHTVLVKDVWIAQDKVWLQDNYGTLHLADGLLIAFDDDGQGFSLEEPWRPERRIFRYTFRLFHTRSPQKRDATASLKEQP